MTSPCLVGRSRGCELREPSQEASGEHALIRWRGGRWFVQDLHSLNGTYVDGRRIAPGQPVPLEDGACLGFGHPEGYVLVDGGPPIPHAIDEAPPHEVVEAIDGRLSLPHPRTPEVVVRRHDDRWCLERGRERSMVENGDVVPAGSRSWRLRLPEWLSSTLDVANASGAPPTLASVSLCLVTTEVGDELQSIIVSHGSQSTQVPPRAYHRPLLPLARARREDPTPLEEDRGWVEQSTLRRELGYTTSRLHVEIHRLRREFAAIGIIDAHMVVERRPHTRNLRLGIGQVEIRTASDPRG
ncbi:MAG: FHA domain-containing protein [Myxococcales bacterium]|nr:FHA domain-containing protein [Myxococcales bacterium]MCB9718559.1 FHA domain-containing protein [Myxococcales bacterium]